MRRSRLLVGLLVALLVVGLVSSCGPGTSKPGPGGPGDSSPSQATTLPPAASPPQPEPAPPGTPAPTTAPSGQLEVHVIDVGQADAILLKTPGWYALIDGGNVADGPAVVGYLKGQGVKSLDLLVNTHPHEDHVGGLPAVLKAFPVKRVIFSGYVHTTRIYEEFLELLTRAKETSVEGPKGQVVTLPAGGELRILGPLRKDYEDLNDGSVVARLTFGQVSFLFMGDAEARAEEDLVASGAELRATILKVGHHGSDSGTTEAFLKKVQPKAAVISVGKGNDYGHPAPETLERLRAAGADVYRTDEQGTIVITTDGKGFKVNNSPWAITPPANAPPAVPTAPATSPAPAPQAPTALRVEASVSNPTPAQYSTVTVYVVVTDQAGKPIEGATVTTTAHYKSSDTAHSGVTGADGKVAIDYRISRATKGFTVRVNVVAEKSGVVGRGETAFTPR